VDSELQDLGRRLVGHWTSDATHPQMPGVTVAGSATFEWLEGQRFVIFRSHYDHPELPDAVSIIGDTDGFHMHYFDSRGVFRLYELTVIADGWTIAIGRQSPTGSFAPGKDPFSQRVTYRFGNGDKEMSGKGQLSHDDVNWDEDLEITYRRVVS